MGTKNIDDNKYEGFESRHQQQLLAAGVPKHFWRRLHEKLVNEIFDAGDFFQILEEINEDGKHHYTVVALQQLRMDDPNCIFLIDHAWTFRPQIARRQLREIPDLLDRICNVFNIEDQERSTAESHSDYGGSGDDSQIPSGLHWRTGSNEDEGIVKSMSHSDSLKKHNDNKCDGNAGSNNSKLDAEAGPSNFKERHNSLPESITGTPMSGSLTTVSEEERRINEVLHHMWRYIHTYTMRFLEKEPDECDMPLWYMPDEFGVRIGHSHLPNCRMVPIFHMPENIAYNLLFPIQNVEIEEAVTRDYVDTMIMRTHPEWRHILMHPWIPVDLTGERLEHIVAPDSHFTRSCVPDILPLNAPDVVPGIHLSSKKVHVFGDDLQFFSNLKTVEIVKVNCIEDADLIWMRKHFSDYKSLYEKNPKALVNQYPYDSVLTVKDLLTAAIQSVYRDSVIDPELMHWQPLWFETTFNLETELPQFVAYYQQRARKNMDNTWIVKPWNLARGLDIHVTDNLSYIIRLIESGPKIACKYIHRPVLFRRPDNGNMVKFDLRYIIFLRCLRPLKLFLCKNFWVRFAINDFSLSQLDDRDTHFTVFNYSEGDNVLNMHCEDFIDQWEKLYAVKWSEIQEKINEVIKDVIKTVSKEKAPRGIVPNAQSRAMYGMDIMLKWDSDDFATRKICVSFIEGNFMPDCDRACMFYADFAETAFNALFTDKNIPDTLIELI
ncbi:protein KIAA0153, putative [Brugia malayi]|uniref:BMA-TTLL-12 n=2 Tax=Brugia malayi TaxID=6279 RepID=A0A0K0J8I0_BRUMA|nr:protein KIAA0153, putative [Brugia malayi]CRZ24235.1 BMA-TTLL-12 [Brugia malayi]VIO93236.1 protein KIAA0153, putative [Brugia malayi]